MTLPDIIPGFEETEIDRLYTPTVGCCAECAEEAAFARWEAEQDGRMLSGSSPRMRNIGGGSR